MKFFQEIFKPAWKLAWKNKQLWFFGFFATALGAGSNYEAVAQALDVVTGKNAASLPSVAFFWQSEYWSIYSPGNIIRFGSQEPLHLLLLVLTLVFGFIFFAILIWFILVSLGALIFGVHAAAKGEKVSFGEAFHVGRENFWKLLVITFEAKIAAIIAFFIVSIPLYLFLQLNNSFAVGFYFLAFVALVMFVLVISFAAFYASAFAVLKNQNVLEAWASGYRLFKNNWLVSVEMMVLILFLNLLFIIAFVIGTFLLISIPLTILFFAFLYLALPAGVLFAQITGGILLFGAIIFMAAFFTVFEIASWMILFEKLQRKTRSALERITASLSARFRS